jgi:hypothetical protein
MGRLLLVQGIQEGLENAADKVVGGFWALLQCSFDQGTDVKPAFIVAPKQGATDVSLSPKCGVDHRKQIWR